MDAPSLTPERSRELADLRRRAYGPDADIQRDPNALHRLHELEGLAREQHVAPVDTVSPPPASPPVDQPPAGDRPAEADTIAAPTAAPTAAVSAAVPTGEPLSAPADPRTTPPAPLARRRWWRRIPVWVVAAVSLIAGVVIGVSALWFSQPDSTESADLTLGISREGGDRRLGFAQSLDYWGVDRGSVVPYEAFDTIGVWTARGSDESRCLLLSYEGQIFAGTCASGGLDPVYDLMVEQDRPVKYERPLDEGSVIRFIAREGAVDVWVRPAGVTLTDFMR